MTMRTGVIRPLPSDVSARPLIVIGQPGDKRTEGIRQAREQLGLPPALVVPLDALLRDGAASLSAWTKPWLDGLGGAAGARADNGAGRDSSCGCSTVRSVNGSGAAARYAAAGVGQSVAGCTAAANSQSAVERVVEAGACGRAARHGGYSMSGCHAEEGRRAEDDRRVEESRRAENDRSVEEGRRAEDDRHMEERRHTDEGSRVPDDGRAGDGGCPSPLVRLEAPGGSFEVERALIALGAPDAEPDADDSLHLFGPLPDPRPIGAAAALRLKELPGVLHHPSQWFRGYCRLLARLRRELPGAVPGAEWQNDPADIAAMTDKRVTQQLLAAAGVAIPRPLGGGKPPFDYDSLRQAMGASGMHRVFVKLAFGSAASGVIAYQVNPATGAEMAVTTIGVERYAARPPIYYNSGKPRRYTSRSDIAPIVDWLYRHGAYAEQWIPKNTHKGKAFDIRQLVVGGEACHAIARVSATPITNLHLRSERMTPEQAGLSREAEERVRRIAERTAAVFPRSFVAGIDVLVSDGAQRCYVADVNPFGDLLYRTDYRGMGPYEWEMAKLSGAFAARAVPVTDDSARIKDEAL